MNQVGEISAMAVRPAPHLAMHEITATTAAAGSGLVGDHGDRKRRGITFLSAVQWRECIKELGSDLPWHIRRANILVNCDRLDPLIGKTIKVGQAQVLIHAETKPCAVMDDQYPGLQEVLRPEYRGGVYGQVIEGGVITVGDLIVLV
jgi:MOSC domain-containing protein YiiM